MLQFADAHVFSEVWVEATVNAYAEGCVGAISTLEHPGRGRLPSRRAIVRPRSYTPAPLHRGPGPNPSNKYVLFTCSQLQHELQGKDPWRAVAGQLVAPITSTAWTENFLQHACCTCDLLPCICADALRVDSRPPWYSPYVTARQLRVGSDQRVALSQGLHLTRACVCVDVMPGRPDVCCYLYPGALYCCSRHGSLLWCWVTQRPEIV